MKTKTLRYSKLLVLALSCVLSFSTFQAVSEDIDIFSVDFDNTVNAPNVLIVLDNSSNWSRQSQDWPENRTQGESEVRAIKQVINQLPSGSVNVGLLEYTTDGNANENDGGYVRFHIRPMNAANKLTLSNHLTTIEGDINGPIEKRSQGNPFGTLFQDVYNYLAGEDQSGGNVSAAGSGTPASRADSGAYTNLYSRFRSPLTTADTCRRTIIIFIGNNVSNGPTSDSPANVSRLQSLGGSTAQIPFADYVITSTPSTVTKGTSAICHADVNACTSAESGTSCADAGFTSCSCVGPGTPCQDSEFTVFGRSTTQTPVSGPTTPPPTTESLGEAPLECKNANQVPGGSSCPQTATVFTPGPGTDETTETTTSWSNCVYTDIGNTGCSGQKRNYERQGTKTVTTTVRRTTSTNTQLSPPLSSCAADSASCDTTGFPGCPPGGSTYTSCFCNTPSDSSACPPGSTSRFQVVGNFNTTTATQTGTFSPAPAGPFMMDEWARFLRQTGVPLPGTNPAIKTPVTTYTIDVFNKQQHPDFSALLFNTARVGGGKYFQAKNENAIVTALTDIFNEVQAVNSAFASASLPVNATNRTQNENQVFIGLFRPDRQKNPLWFGNLKRYQVIASGAGVALGDATGAVATNNQTGFIGDCAASYWTTASGDYWDDVLLDDPPAVSQCPGVANPHSDLPDGPFVEKGAVADVLRKRGSPRNMKTASGAGTLIDFNTTNVPSLDADTVNFILGKDFGDKDFDNDTNDQRPSIHGDVIHSRPQPVNYGGTAAEIASDATKGVVVYYGANDGTYRAVRAHNGEELWSFVAPEHFHKMSRLKDNVETIRFFNDTSGAPKDYFFDGSTGVFQNANNTNVRVFTTMRRGGRKIYSFNVTNPTTPTGMWSKGCTDPEPPALPVCDTDFSDLGQIWSFPNVAFIKGFSETTPVVVIGGGYDTCEDSGAVPPSCGTGSRGSGVYVLDSTNGTLLRHFDFNGRSVVADVSMIDANGDRRVDYAYAADTGGKIYRMDFVNSSGGPLNSAAWTFREIAHTNATSNRKFLFTPALAQVSSSIVYLAISSGDREHPLITQYPYTDVVNRFYVFKDDLSVSTGSLNLDDTTGTVMKDYTIEPPGCPNSHGTGSPAVVCPQPILPASSAKGWFMNLTANGQGEQGVSAALIAGGFAIFNTNRPTPASTQVCTNSLGEARGYFLNLFSSSGAIGVSGDEGGDRSAVFIGGGLPPSPVMATVPICDANGCNPTTVLIGAAPKGGGVACTVCPDDPKFPIGSKRTPLYWYKSGDTK